MSAKTIDEYEAFKARKAISSTYKGFDANTGRPWLHPFQAYIADIALKHGRYAVFADTGLGKTRIEICIAQEVVRKTKGRVLILAPLGVVPQTVAEAEKLGVNISRDLGEGDIVALNYDKLHLVDPSQFSAILLDESSILKNFAGATKKLLCETFAQTPYRFCFTATPSPNDVTELGNHSDFLGVMSMTAMLSRWFVHDSANTSEWRLKKHAETDFWRWVASWAIALRKPSDIGFSDQGYILPPLTTKQVIVSMPDDLGGQGVLISDARLSATNMHAEMRRSAGVRAQAVADLVAAEPDEPWFIVCDTDYEADEVKKRIPTVKEVSGKTKDSVKEDLMLGFGRGDFDHFLAKSSMTCLGLNYQRCARVALVGASYSFERVYQVLRRCWRYGQTREVIGHIVSTDGEWSVLASQEKKEKANELRVTKMIEQMGNGSKAVLVETTGEDAKGENWELLRGDNVKRIKDIKDHSVGLMVTSVPFDSLYTYSDTPEDMSNCANPDEFMEHMGFLVKELSRVMMPGRLCCIHCMDLPSSKEKDGFIGLRDFPAEMRELFQKFGFIYHSKVLIWKDPLLAAVRTKALGLLHKQLMKDSCMCRQGIADYMVIMRAPGVNIEPVSHPMGFTEWIGEPGEEPQGVALNGPSGQPVYSHLVWQKYASPVWDDINQTDVLPFAGAREEKDERHICALQKQVPERCIALWSNPGDLVLDPFSGVATTGYVALQNDRRYVGIELKKSYFDQGCINLRSASVAKHPSLFDEDLVTA